MNDNVAPDLWEKMRKVLNLTQSSNEHEAALALEKLKQMTAKYDVTIEDIMSRAQGVNIARETFNTGMKNKQLWMSIMIRAVADYTDTKSFFGSNFLGELEYRFYGYERDRKIACYMAEYLHHNVQDLAKQAWKRFDLLDMERPDSDARNWQTNYKMGFMEGVEDQLKSLRAEEHPSNTGTALVVLKGQEINEWLKKNIKVTKTAKRYYTPNEKAYHMGRNDGRKHRIRKGIGHND